MATRAMRVRPTDAPDDPKYLGGISHPRDNISDYKWQPEVATKMMAKSQKPTPSKEYLSDVRDIEWGELV